MNTENRAHSASVIMRMYLIRLIELKQIEFPFTFEIKNNWQNASRSLYLEGQRSFNLINMRKEFTCAHANA